MERSVEIIAMVLSAVLGLSHIVQSRAWAAFFVRLRASGEPGMFVDGFLNLAVAVLVIGFHNVWAGIPALLTLLGWCLLVKSLIRFCAPRLALRAMGRVSLERAWEFQVAGAGLLVFAGILGYGLSVG